MSTIQLICLGVNAAVLIYYGRQYVKVQSFYKKIEKANPVVTIDAATLSALVGQYVCISGKIKALADTLPSKYTSAINGVIQQTQVIKHQLVRAAMFWLRRREVSEAFTLQSVPFALVNNANYWKNVQVLIKNPLAALKQTATADLFTGYKNVSWPVSNIIHDRFIVNKYYLVTGAHNLGIQETESLILDGGYITAVGYLKESKGSYSVVPDILTSCDYSMLLKKVADLRSELVSKLIVFGTIGAILAIIIYRKRKRMYVMRPSEYHKFMNTFYGRILHK